MKMKMAILSLCGIMVLGACGNQEDAKVSENSSTTTQTQTTNGEVEKQETKEEVKENKIERVGLGDTLVVSEDGVDLYEITFNKAFLTDERNQFSDDTSENVIVLEYTYKNLSVEDGLNVFEGTDFRVYDANGAALSTYPAGAELYGGTVSVGRSGTSQEAFGFNGDPQQTLEIEIYGSFFNSTPLAIVEVQAQ